MRVTRFGWALWAPCAVLLVVPAQALAQGPQATPLPPPSGDSIVQELRLLRQAIERSGRGSAQVQLMLGRLTLQDQRVARAQEALDRLDDQAFALERERRRLDAEVVDLTRQIEQAADPGRRTDAEAHLRSARTRQSEQLSLAAPLESRRSRLRQSLSEEQARYRELDARFTELERELGDDLGAMR